MTSRTELEEIASLAAKKTVEDLLLKLGVTDALGDNLTSIMMTIIACYFGGRTIEKVAQIFKR